MGFQWNLKNPRTEVYRYNSTDSFLCSASSVNVKHAPSSRGISPDNLFGKRFNTEIWFTFPNSKGMELVKELLDKLTQL